MKMEIEFEVTQKDIDKGIPQHGCNCPVALAIKRDVPGLVLSCVIASKITTGRSNNVYNTIVIRTTPELNEFIDTVDLHGKQYVKPTRFKLEYDPELCRIRY